MEMFPRLGEGKGKVNAKSLSSELSLCHWQWRNRVGSRLHDGTRDSSVLLYVPCRTVASHAFLLDSTRDSYPHSESACTVFLQLYVSCQLL